MLVQHTRAQSARAANSGPVQRKCVPYFLLLFLSLAFSLFSLFFSSFPCCGPLSVQSGKYAAWDNIELPLEAPEDDHFDHFEGEQDDYTMFMTETRAACDHEVHIIRDLPRRYTDNIPPIPSVIFLSVSGPCS